MTMCTQMPVPTSLSNCIPGICGAGEAIGQGPVFLKCNGKIILKCVSAGELIRLRGTTEVEAEVYELVKDASTEAIFRCLSDNLRQACLERAQIENFLKEHRRWLRKFGYETFALTEEDRVFLLACIHFQASRKEPDAQEEPELEFIPLPALNGIWGAMYGHRVVVPKRT